MDDLGLTLKELKQRHMKRWVGYVDWMDEHTSFADSGDSGSLVYAMKNGGGAPRNTH